MTACAVIFFAVEVSMSSSSFKGRSFKNRKLLQIQLMANIF